MNKPANAFISLEALVAFIILTTALVGVYQAFTTSYASARKVISRELALAEAQSWLESAGINQKLRIGNYNGKFPSGALWKAEISLIEPGLPPGDGTRLERYWVRLDVADSRGNDLLDLESIYIATAEDE